MSKRIIALVLLLLVIGVAAWYVISRQNLFSTSNNSNTQTTNNQKTTKPAQGPFSQNGTVKSVNSTSITLLLPDNKTTKTFLMIPAAPPTVVQRSTSKTGTTTLVPSKLSNVKVGSSIVVYTTTDSSTSPNALVSKIEIVK